MLSDTLKRIENRLAAAGLEPQRRAELEALLAELRAELGELGEADGDRARSVAGFTEISSHEALRQPGDRNLQELSLQGLGASVEGLEADYPRLVRVVNALCDFLSGMGV